MIRRPWLTSLLIAVPLLLASWLAVRLAIDLTGIERLCRGADWYAASRCEPRKIVLRGALTLMLPVAGLIALLLVAMHGRLRGRLEESEMRWLTAMRACLGSTPPVHLTAIAALTLIAIAVRLPLLTAPMRSDENQTLLLYSGQSLTAAVWQFDTTNNHILFSALTRLPVALFGAVPWAARMIELVCGVFLVPATALALRAVRTPGAALIAAAIVAGLPYFAVFSTNARGYSLVALLFVLAVPTAVELARISSVFGSILFATMSALALLTNPTAIYPFGALGVWVVQRRVASGDAWQPVLREALAGAGLTLAITWALYGPALTAMGTEALFANPWVRPPAWGTFTGTLGVVLDGTARELWDQWGWGLPRVAAAAMIVGMAWALATDARPDRESRGMLTVAVLWTAIVATVTHRVPYTRVLLPFVPLLLAGAASALITFLDALRLPTERDARVTAVIAIIVALLLATVRESASTLYMTAAPRGATAFATLLSSMDVGSRVVGDRSAAHGARAHSRTGAARGHAEHA